MAKVYDRLFHTYYPVNILQTPKEVGITFLFYKLVLRGVEQQLQGNRSRGDPRPLESGWISSPAKTLQLVCRHLPVTSNPHIDPMKMSSFAFYRRKQGRKGGREEITEHR